MLPKHLNILPVEYRRVAKKSIKSFNSGKTEEIKAYQKEESRLLAEDIKSKEKKMFQRGFISMVYV